MLNIIYHHVQDIHILTNQTMVRLNRASLYPLTGQIILLLFAATWKRVKQKNWKREKWGGIELGSLIQKVAKRVPIQIMSHFVSGYPPSPETLGVLEPVGDFSTSLLYIK